MSGLSALLSYALYLLRGLQLIEGCFRSVFESFITIVSTLVNLFGYPATVYRVGYVTYCWQEGCTVRNLSSVAGSTKARSFKRRVNRRARRTRDGENFVGG
ncbi:hypothetical protein Tcan_18257 [Toxocara canis]|uniref:Uncharacterized protein n=1 Tax=Toxocara canis TaxID=6265 RepID=A0A0B2VYG4_TOXCA|nr:hypothetical protein Tcan_18257 [Toxocara canis]